MTRCNVFIFRRDLRIQDNLALNQMKLTYPDIPILPIFIFNPKQILPSKNKYFSEHAVQFMFQSFESLPTLNFYYSPKDITVLEELLTRYDIQSIGYNLDYTPFAKKRDADIQTWAHKHHIPLITAHDYTLHPIPSILNQQHSPYIMFTPFYRKAMTLPVAKPVELHDFHFLQDPKQFKKYQQFKPSPPHPRVHGGRPHAMTILHQLRSNQFQHYDQERDYPYLDKTTHLSAYLKFGCVSIREVCDCLPKTHGIVRELLWHDFYANVIYHFPHVIGNSFKIKYDTVWDESYNEEWFNRWKEGKTGYPLVDASMRQLRETGWMHNRCRMIVASFLTKNLLIDWRMGEQYFATQLIDYDPSSNNGGWQWCASTGTDSQPYFRIFSPTEQLKKFDPDCQYVKQWIPELRQVANKHILKWALSDTPPVLVENYPARIVDASKQAKAFIEKIKSV